LKNTSKVPKCQVKLKLAGRILESRNEKQYGFPFYHQPVLVEAVLQWLVTDRSGMYVDCTAGGGGHSNAILERLDSGASLLLIDRDEQAVEQCKGRFSGVRQVTVIQGELKAVDFVLENLAIKKVTGFLCDLGVSSHHIDAADRGFSYSTDGPLDMRMDRRLAGTAADILNGYSERDLADLFFYYGEERKSKALARRIVEERNRHPIKTSEALNAVIRKSVPGKWFIKTLARIYQALRIEVNDELNQLKTGLEKMYPFLDPGGRIVAISYHSLEDRVVKHFFRGGPVTFFGEGFEKATPRFLFTNLTGKVVRPSAEEVHQNPRARSARLRAAEKRPVG